MILNQQRATFEWGKHLKLIFEHMRIMRSTSSDAIGLLQSLDYYLDLDWPHVSESVDGAAVNDYLCLVEVEPYGRGNL